MLHWLWRTSVEAAVVAIFVLLLRVLFGRAITARWRHALWLLVLARLVIPVLPTSRVSLFIFNSSSSSLQPASSANADFPEGNLSHVLIDYGLPPPLPRASRQKLMAEENIRWWQTPVSHEAIGMGIWLAISGALLTRFVLADFLFAWRLKSEGKSAPADVVSLLEECCSMMNLSRRPLLVVTDTVASPAITGVLKPRLLLPCELVNTLSHAQLRLIFLHELTHIRCGDLAVDWLWMVLQSIHWFNPILWLIGPIRRRDREMARDEMVLSITGSGQADAYCQTLLQLAQTAELPFFCPGLVGIVSGTRHLKRRVEMIARFSGKRIAATWLGIVLLVFSASCALTNPAPRPSSSNVEREGAKAPIASGDDDAVTPDEAATRAALDKRVDSLEFTQMPFDQVIDHFRTITGLNFYVAWPELNRVRIRRTAPVTVRLHGITISKALELVFKTVEPSVDYDHNLGYLIDGKVVTISTQRDLDKNVVTRRYDIKDLIPSASQPYDQTLRESQINDLQRYIMTNVGRETWRENGGDASDMSASPLRCVLLITTTPENHRKIRNLLATLRLNQPRAATVTFTPTVDPVDENKIETSKYLINDLLFQPPNYFLNASNSDHAQEKQDPALLRAARVADVEMYIQSNVATSSWKEHGGKIGAIELDRSGDFLLITQTHGHQRDIAQTLETLRRNRAPQISVEMRVFLFDEATVEDLPQPLHQRVAALSGVGRNRTDQFLSDGEVKQMVQHASESKSSSTLTAPRLTLFSGQHAYVEVSERQAYVQSMTAASSSSNGKITWAFTPVTGMTDSTRLYFPCTTCNAPDQRSAFIDMQPKFTRLLGLMPEYWTGPVSDHDAVIQKPISVDYERSVTCAIPDRATLLCALNLTISDSRNPKALRPGDEKRNEGVNQSIERAKHQQGFLLVTPGILPGLNQQFRQ